MALQIRSSSFPAQADTSHSLLEASNLRFDFVTSSIASTWVDVGTGVQTMSVGTFAAWPSNSYVTLDNEIVYYAFTSGGALCVPSDGRACFGTTLAAHESGTRVEQRIIAEYHNRSIDAIMRLQSFVSTSAYPSMSPYESGNQTWSQSLNTHWMRSGNLEDRVRFLEWAIIELMISGTFTTITDSVDGTKGSRQLRSSSWTD